MDRLPPNIYCLLSDHEGLYLQSHDHFKLPPKLYGDTTHRADRILNTFDDRRGNTGVLLTGEKGSGKSLLAKVVSMRALGGDYSTILVNAPYHGDAFSELMESIDDPCVLLFDEFEKVYSDKDHQKAMLTFMDGSSTKKRLLLLTCNDLWSIDIHMINRPGRLYYHYSFTGLSESFIEDYCNDHLRDLEHIQSIIRHAGLFDNFSFDGLQALVEDCNRYNESPTEALKHLNLKPCQSPLPEGRGLRLQNRKPD